MSKELSNLIERISYGLKVVSSSPDGERRMVELELAERAVENALTDWFTKIDDSLKEIIRDWESRVDDDKSLFSLGVRRAQDVIRGESQVP